MLAPAFIVWNSWLRDALTHGCSAATTAAIQTTAIHKGKIL